MALERLLPEQRLFLRSDQETRFIRLRPRTQLFALALGAVVICWTILATSILMVQSLSSGDPRSQVLREQANYEARLNTLSAERDARAVDAASAQKRFNAALKQVSVMQSALLSAEDHNRELETGIEVIQGTLRRAIKDRDSARAEADQLRATLIKQTGSDHTQAGREKDVSATLDILSNALASTAAERDEMEQREADARALAARAEMNTKLIEQRNQHIFAKLEEAVSVSMKPLDKMFHSVGLDPNKVLAEVRSGYSDSGTALAPLPAPPAPAPDSTPSGSTASDSAQTAPATNAAEDVDHANLILKGLNEMNLYRLAAERVPLGMPVKSAFRFSSPFGYRKDPINGERGTFHPGVDMAARYGTPLYAPADGIVIRAGWGQGYGREIRIQHAFGIMTLYGHLSQIRVHVGQRVSRGERIGDMGSSGRSTGSHLHYGVYVGGKPVNPMTFIKAANYVF